MSVGLIVVIQSLMAENERLKTFVQKIANEDYRDNSAPHRLEAEILLKTKEGGGE